MGRLDRRNRLALDESYRYYRSLEAGESPSIFQITKSLNTLSTALVFSEHGEFKLTRQLWKRLQQAFFDALINNFGGDFVIVTRAGEVLEPQSPWPEDSTIRFRPEGCRRAEDSIELEVSRLYPKTLTALQTTWAEGSKTITPADLDKISECDNGVCMMRPMVLGHEVLGAESATGKSVAYRKWWDFYWQAYCSPKKQDRSTLYQQMMHIESVWGDMYY